MRKARNFGTKPAVRTIVFYNIKGEKVEERRVKVNTFHTRAEWNDETILHSEMEKSATLLPVHRT